VFIEGSEEVEKEVVAWYAFHSHNLSEDQAENG
jgi:hypothetical protein